MSLGLLVPLSGSYSFLNKYRLNRIVLHSLYLLTSCGRGLQGSSHRASIVAITCLACYLSHYTCATTSLLTTLPSFPIFSRISERPPYNVSVVRRSQQFHSASAELIRLSTLSYNVLYKVFKILINMRYVY